MNGNVFGNYIHIYSISVMHDEFLLKSVVFKIISKEISRAEHKYMNIHPPPPPPRVNALATALILFNIHQTAFDEFETD